MLKKGFTLAEVLITLGIIGVVAALTTPALVQNIGTAKVGPSLAKAVSTFQNANQTMLAQLEAGSITSLSSYVIREGQAGSSSYRETSQWSPSTYMYNLAGHLKVSPGNLSHHQVPFYTIYNHSTPYYPVRGAWNDHAYSLEDGSMYYYIIPHHNYKIRPHRAYINTAANQRIGDVYIDINGYARPNKQAKDIFRFYLYNDGSLKPYGSNAFDKSNPPTSYTHYWNTGSCDDGSVSYPDSCAGSVFENNMKVIYE